MIAGLAATAPHAGIDLQLVHPRDAAFEGFAFNEEERDLLDHVGLDRDEWITRFWCGKRAVIKALGKAVDRRAQIGRCSGCRPTNRRRQGYSRRGAGRNLPAMAVCYLARQYVA